MGAGLSSVCFPSQTRSGGGPRRRRLSGDLSDDVEDRVALNEGGRCSPSSSVHFGPMVLKSKEKIALLLQRTTQDRISSQLEKQLESAGYHCIVVSSAREAEAHFSLSLPCLLFLDGRASVSPSAEESLTQLQSFVRDSATAVFVYFDKLPSAERRRQLVILGATRLFRFNNRTFNNELCWFECAILPVQSKLRSVPALFAALERSDNAVEITDSFQHVQYVNPAYEALTGCRKSEILGSLACNLRRKSLPRELDIRTTASAVVTSTDDKYRRKSLTINPTVSIYITDEDENTKTNMTVTNGWKTFGVPFSKHSSVNCQFVHMKQTNDNTLALNPYNAFYRRPPSFRNKALVVDTPLAETLALLKDAVLKTKDADVQEALQKAIRSLNFAELYSPLITKFRNDDRVASNLFGGLVLNGTLSTTSPLQKVRKTSLCDIMKSDRSTKYASDLMKSMSPTLRSVLDLEETWEFNILELERLTNYRPMVHLAMKIFERWKVCDFLQCTEARLKAWLEVIESNYHPDNAYHNSTHATDVLHASAYYLGSESISESIEHTDAVAALIASVIHDVDHPGKGSAFLINTKHPLALLYNDVSVLENHHAALAFQLTVGDTNINIFENLPQSEYKPLRKSIVDMVLATDMNRHFENLAKFQNAVLTNYRDPAFLMENNGDGKKCASPEHKVIICRMLIKCADVSNPSRNWSLCKEWGLRIVDEYFAQTAEERAKGLPFTMEVFDKETCNIPQTQCSFIDMFVREMFRGWCAFGQMPQLLTLIERNYELWRRECDDWPASRETLRSPRGTDASGGGGGVAYDGSLDVRCDSKSRLLIGRGSVDVHMHDDANGASPMTLLSAAARDSLLFRV